MNLRGLLLLFCFVLAVSGGELLYQSMQLSPWTDEAKAEEVQSWPAPDEISGPGYKAYYQRWAHAIDTLRTQKYPLKDAGATLLMLGLCLAGSVLLLGINTPDDLYHLETPRSRWTIYALGALGWFGYWASTVAALIQGFNRFEFPTWADTLFVPMLTIAGVALVGWLALSITALVYLSRAQLPALLWIWRKDLPLHTGLSTGIAATFLLIAAELLRETYLYGHWSAVPALFLWVYAALCFRAAAISRGQSAAA